MSKQIDGKPPPKNGFFYTIDELKEYGCYNYNLDSGIVASKKPETPKRNPEQVLKELEKQKIKTTIEKPKKDIEKPKKDVNKPKTPTKISKKTTTKDPKKVRKKTVVKKEDKLEWITVHGKRTLIYNGEKITGRKSYTLWKKWQLLNQDEIDKEKEEKIKNKTKKEKKNKESSSDDEYEEEIIEIE